MRMKITGTGSALPERIITNQDLTGWVETSDEWIRERTGIAERRISTGETVVSLAVKACSRALDQAGRKAQEVDLILLATCSPEFSLPCCACQVQAELGAVNAAAFDINAACSGFLFGLNMADAYIKTGMYRKILVIGSEVLSKFIDWKDRSTCILFGDGAGAVLAEAVDNTERSRMIVSIQGSDGKGGSALSCRERLVRNPVYDEFEFMESDKETFRVTMDGQAVYRFAARQVSDCIRKVLEKSELTVADIDLFVLHQANIRIIETVAKRVCGSNSPEIMEKFPVNLERYGNMSSATIPVLLDELNRGGCLHRGQKIVLSGFGAGLTFGASVIVW